MWWAVGCCVINHRSYEAWSFIQFLEMDFEYHNYGVEAGIFGALD